MKDVDFAALKDSPVRLLISAVNVTTARLETFDSHVDDLTPDHLVAGGGLPPGLPWTVIGGKAYCGGNISNSPLDLAIDRSGRDGKRVFIVDQFSGERALPGNMMEVMMPRDEIVQSEPVRSHLHLRERTEAYRRLASHILSQLDPAKGPGHTAPRPGPADRRWRREYHHAVRTPAESARAHHPRLRFFRNCDRGQHRRRLRDRQSRLCGG
ncbi:patatin-like phospholipase domain-containing protein [Neoroseomonas lacus]|uniref:PNPLA domain-containing protein n=1 Tax=Neoroseomonas lacus TaxID=287609 RepID=A0A917L5H3_9PROT|nr:hypothetical protein [Neoroseomonas lacus]GGJ43376.1 hypothetical protein GCM10011320_58580 [Neoroseomonas lacus]